MSRRPGGDRHDGPLLERQQIVDAALALIHEHGLDGMTMRKLGDALDVSSMAIYWYFANKEELVAAATDQVFALVVLPDVEELHWTEGLRVVAREVRRVIVDYPGVADQLLTHQRYPPSTVALVEFGMAALRSAGLDVEEATEAFDLLASAVVTRAHVEAHQRLEERKAAADATTAAERVRDGWHRLAESMGDEHPHTRRYLEQLDGGRTGPDLFERMVDLIVLGLATEVERRG